MTYKMAFTIDELWTHVHIWGQICFVWWKIQFFKKIIEYHQPYPLHTIYNIL